MICVIEFISKSNVKGDSLFLKYLRGTRKCRLRYILSLLLVPECHVSTLFFQPAAMKNHLYFDTHFRDFIL